jgi:hypothetical protein
MESRTYIFRANRKPVQRFSELPRYLPTRNDLELAYGCFSWEHRVSSGGVPIMVAQLGKSALIRRTA